MENNEQQFFLSKFLGSTLKTDIKYISSCFIRRKVVNKGDQFTAEILLIISKEKVYGFSKTMDKIKFEFPFDKIKKIEIEKIDPKSVLFELSGYILNKKNVPLIVIYIENRDTFLKYLQCYYSTFYAETMGTVNELKIKTVEYFTYENKKMVPKKIATILHELPDDYIQYEFFNYQLFIHKSFVKKDKDKHGWDFKAHVDMANSSAVASKEKGGNSRKIELNCSCYIRSSGELPIENLDSSNSLKLSLHAYEVFTKSVCQALNISHHIITKDRFYIKKFNLGLDTSLWEGWAIESLSTKPTLNKIYFYHLRRKYIPPLLESYEDIWFVCSVDLSKIKEEDSNYFENNGIYEVEMIMETMVDSVYSDFHCYYKDYLSILEARADSLTLDRRSIKFYNNSLGIFGKETYPLGLQFVLKVLDLILMNFSTKEFEKIKRVFDLVMDKLILFLKSTLKQNYSRQQISSFLAGKTIMDVWRNINEIISEFPTKNGIDPQIVEKNRTKVKENWEYRVNEFLYFCLDGGVMNGLFDIENLFDIINENKGNNYAVDLNLIINNLLNVKKEPSTYGEKMRTYFSGDRTKIRSLSYNENLLCKIIKFYDIKIIFEFENESQELDFYTYVLEKNFSFKILSIIIFILEAFDYKFSKIFKEEAKSDIAKANYVKNIRDIAKQFYNIYENEKVNTRISTLALKILNMLTLFDSTASIFLSLLNLNFLQILANRLNHFDFYFHLLNLEIFFILGQNLLKLETSKKVVESKFLYEAINLCIKETKYRGSKTIVKI